MTLEECVNKSFPNSKTKSSTLSLIKKYINFYNQIIGNSINSSQGDLEPEEINTIYDPKNAYEFVVNDNNYNRSSIKKNLNIQGKKYQNNHETIIKGKFRYFNSLDK